MAAVEQREDVKVKDLISDMSGKRITKGLLDRLVARLVAAGALGEERSKVLGLRRWPTADPGPEQEVLARLQSSLVGDATPTERTVALIALLQITGQLTKVVSTGDKREDKKALKAKAKTLTEGDWAAAAVKQAIDEVYAMMASMVGGQRRRAPGAESGLDQCRVSAAPSWSPSGTPACPTWSARDCGCSSSGSIPACGPRPPRPTSRTPATVSTRPCGMAGIVDHELDRAGGMTDDDRDYLVGRGIGITNLVNRASVRADELSRAELRAGSERLTAFVAEHRPRVIAVAGVTAYRTAFARPKASAGRQPEQLAGAELWVVPNPSGLNAHETIGSLAAAYAEPARAAGVLA